MIQSLERDDFRVNARKTDAFDIFNLRHYIGPNPYLDTGALVFDFCYTGYLEPRPLTDYVFYLSQHYPRIAEQSHPHYAHLFAQAVSEVGKLDMDLHLNRWSLKTLEEGTVRIAVQALHAKTMR
jgi:cyanophycin synthetase